MAGWCAGLVFLAALFAAVTFNGLASDLTGGLGPLAGLGVSGAALLVYCSFIFQRGSSGAGLGDVGFFGCVLTFAWLMFLLIYVFAFDWSEEASGYLALLTLLISFSLISIWLAEGRGWAEAASASQRRVASAGLMIGAALACAATAARLYNGAGVEAALLAAVPVLLMAAPVLNHLAVFSALAFGRRVAGRYGVCFDSLTHLRAAAEIDAVFFARTGVLSEATPYITDIRAFDRDDARLLRITASAVLAATHPISQAIVREAQRRGLSLTSPAAFVEIPGEGVVAELAGQRVAIGNAALMARERVDGFMIGQIARSFEAEGKSSVNVALAGFPVGVIALADPLRPEAQKTVMRLRRAGMKTVLSSGESHTVATVLAGYLGLEEVVRREGEQDISLHAAYADTQGWTPAFVDRKTTPLEGEASYETQISLCIFQSAQAGAMGAVACDSIEIAPVNLSRLPDVFLIARRAVAMARWNSGIALAFTMIAIPAALSGAVTAGVAFLAFLASALGIILNSARLLLYHPDQKD